MDAQLSSIPDLLRRVGALATAGYAIALHVRFLTPTYLFQSYPPDWLETYSREGLLMRDPTVLWGFSNAGTIPWSELADPDRVIARAAERGLRHGVTIAMEGEGSRSLASFARPDRPFAHDEAATLEHEMRTLHDATTSARPLPKRTHEALRQMSVAVTHP